MVSTTRGLLALAALGAALAGCGGGGGNEKIAAKAGDVSVTLADFHTAYNNITPKNRPDISTLEARRSFTNDLVNRAILLAEGERMGGILDANVLGELARNREVAMLTALYRDEVEAKVDVLGSDVKELYDHRQENVRASHVLLGTMEEAIRVRAEIESGSISFGDAARKYTLDEATRRNYGSLGEIRWARTVPKFQAVAFTLEAGEMSEPLETKFGVHLIYVEERIKADIGTLDEARIGLRTEVRRHLEQARRGKFVEELEQKADLRFHDHGVQIVIGASVQFEGIDIDTVDTSIRYIPTFSEEELQTPVATFSGRDWTVGDHLNWLKSQPVHQRPFRSMPLSGMKELIRTAELSNELLRDEAYARGYDERSDIVQTSDRLAQKITIELVHGRFIQQADVPPEDVQAIFDSSRVGNPDAFTVPERVDMYIIIQGDEVIVQKALDRLAAGDDEATVVNDHSLDPRTKAAGGRTGLFSRGTFAPKIEDVAFSGVVGQGWIGPVVSNTGVAAIRVVDQQPSRLATFDEVKDQLTSQLALARGEAAFETWLREQRESRGVEIFDEVLELYDQTIS